MPVTTDGLVDEDVSGDGHYAGLTYVFDNVDADWYAPVRYLDISHDRYSFLFRKLGADAPEITVNAVLNDNEQDATAEIVWGSFNQHNDIVSKLEQHVGSIGKRFLFENLTDVTVDDDKLRHTPKSLRFRTTTAETIYFRWVSSVMVFVACQGCTLWF
jgi:hypothetical protein